MARQAKVRDKGGFWVSEARGEWRSFGRVDAVPVAEAQRRLQAFLASGGTTPPSAPDRPPTTTVGALRGLYLDWVTRHRSRRLHDEAKRHLARWVAHVGDVDAMAVTGDDLERFQDALASAGHAPMYVKKHATTVRACFNRGVKMAWIPPTCKPFANVEAIRIDPRPLLETDLPTSDEVRALFAHAKGTFRDLLALYHATGARTHELIETMVGDYQPNARTIVLGRHKRSKTLRVPIPRAITLNVVANDIMQRHTEGRPIDALVFPTRTGAPNTSALIGDMFARLRKRAGVRDAVTIYSFRHLWISDMLMTGVDAMLVARMAGTSVMMIERVYGHFRTQSLHDAQSRLDASRDRSVDSGP